MDKSPIKGPEGIPFQIWQLMSGGSGQQLANLIASVREVYPTLEKICEAIEKERPYLIDCKRRIIDIFGDRHSLEDVFHLQITPRGIVQDGESAIFFGIDKGLQRNLGRIIQEHLNILSSFNQDVKFQIARKPRRSSKAGETDTETSDQIATANAMMKTEELLNRTITIYCTIKENLPLNLDQIYTLIGAYNQYLRDRFVKKDKTKEEEVMQRTIRIIDPKKSVTDYVKIKLIEGNPILTDLLLNLSSDLPEHSEREVRVKGRKRKVKEISRYEIDRATEKLLALSNPDLLDYIRDPKKFFNKIGEIFELFCSSFERLDLVYREVLTSDRISSILTDKTNIEEILNRETNDTMRVVRKIKGADFDGIVQKPEDIVPENKREKDHFELRERMLTLLYVKMLELSSIDRREVETRERIAKDTIIDAIGIKAKIDEILTSFTDRRLRKDKREDNEFYVGRQSGFGRFNFEREPTPQVRLEDVIGASFDRDKKHLSEIIETGNYPRLMRLSAPGGKVRSNILIIGPYGCGKTELARAVCADKRVIGTSVSVAGTLTAFMHESVNNVKRIYDEAKELRQDARDLKPVVLVLDEFDGWFAHSEYGNLSDVDMHQIENVLLEVLDGMEDYNGIITMAMTNRPMLIPKAILRRFRYVDIVGQLTEQERIKMLSMYLEGLPLHEDAENNYETWARRLENAPGDVIRKVVDEIHFKLLPQFIRENPTTASRLERILYRREINKGNLAKRDREYIKAKLGDYKVVITPDMVDSAIDSLLSQPQIRMQIDSARQVYEDAKLLLQELAVGERQTFGLKKRSRLFDIDR